jgi:hypothetical protein
MRRFSALIASFGLLPSAIVLSRWILSEAFVEGEEAVFIETESGCPLSDDGYGEIYVKRGMHIGRYAWPDPSCHLDVDGGGPAWTAAASSEFIHAFCTTMTTTKGISASHSIQEGRADNCGSRACSSWLVCGLVRASSSQRGRPLQRAAGPTTPPLSRSFP